MNAPERPESFERREPELPNALPRPAGELEALERAWKSPRGLSFITDVNNTYVGLWYVGTAFLFFILAGILALIMRAQLAVPESDLVGHDLYNQLFTMHGTVMMFLFAVPAVEAASVYLLPNMQAARDLPFPRLSAYAFWAYFVGGLVFFGTIFFGLAPNGGWFMYPPLTSTKYSPADNADWWLLGIGFIEISAIAGAIEIIVGVMKTRAVGMSLDKLPVYSWAMLVFAVMIVIGFPAIILGTLLLEMERAFDWPFFIAERGGDPLLWQHLFWFFGHPEVYIIFLPATGFVSTIIETFCRRPVFAKTVVILALVSTGLLAFGLWVHHMFATGLPRVGYSFYTAASMAVAIPTGLQIFCWIATIWDGRPRFDTPMLYVIGFIVTFVIGGLTGVIIASVPLDLQLHDTYFIVAHFHYVLIGGAVFPLLGAITYWFPKFTGRMMSEVLGKVSFWMIFLGFQLAFFPMHIAGIEGMPRRVYTYPAGMGLELPNMLSSIGSLVVATAVLLFVINMVKSAAAGAKAGPNPWDASSLEWATASPPPSYNFDHIPVVEGETPLWDTRDRLPVVTGLRVDDRETLLTTVVSAAPESREPIPEPSIWPFVATCAVTVFFVASIFSPWAVLFGAIPSAIALIAWFWPSKLERQPEPVIG
jgi:cytochrome c oxidase subunit I+III